MKTGEADHLTRIETKLDDLTAALRRSGIVPPVPRPVAYACHPDDLDAIKAQNPELTGVPAITSRRLPRNGYTTYGRVEAVVKLVNGLLEGER